MPGERLVCVWQAAFVRRANDSADGLTKSGLQDVVVELSELSTICYSSSKFDQTFKSDSDVNMANFKRYLFEVLCERGSPQCLLQEEVEGRCWELCKGHFKVRSLSEGSVRKLWQISNRLADQNTFPPVISAGVSDWFIDKVCSHLDKNWKSTGTDDKPYTFSALLDKLVDDFFADEMEKTVTSCINHLYSWLVKEVMKSGWLFNRIRKQANWTNWTKRWFVLTSFRLTYYQNTSLTGSSRRGEMFITDSKIEPLPPYNGVFRKFTERFKISNLPYLEMELASEQYNECPSWVTAIQEVIDASRNNTTPIQKLLKDRWDKGHQGTLKQKLEKSEEIASEAAKVQTEPTTPLRKAPKPVVAPKPKLVQKKSSTETFDNNKDRNVIKESNEKIKAVFMRIDADGNGKIDKKEFKQFIYGLGINNTEKEINVLYNAINKENQSYITFPEFSAYFANVLLDESTEGETEAKLRRAFLKADRDGTGTLDFKEFTEYVWDKKRSISMGKILEAFDEMDLKQEGQVSYDQFRDFYKNRMSAIPEIGEYDTGEENLNAVDEKLKEFYNKADARELATFVRERWNKFATLRRYGASGELAMKGGHGMVDDIVPGEYSLLDLALFSDLPPLIPKHTVVKGVKWMSSDSPGKSGKVVFPSDFDGRLVTDTATPEHLRYYGCSFAEGNQLKISLLYRHGIQDFTYENKYLEDYVTLANGGAGIEKHEFSHLDCPLEEDSGTFILAKFVGDDELHLTGFHVPVRQTLYIPGGVIHSNDYLKGTWRTMLSDEADIDHVHLVRPSKSNGFSHFKFAFVK